MTRCNVLGEVAGLRVLNTCMQLRRLVRDSDRQTTPDVGKRSRGLEPVHLLPQYPGCEAPLD